MKESEKLKFEKVKKPKSIKPLVQTQAKFISSGAGMTSPVRVISKSQMVLNELFNNKTTFGTGENLPQMNGALTSGYGLINNLDNGKTSRMFGFGY